MISRYRSWETAPHPATLSGSIWPSPLDTRGGAYHHMQSTQASSKPWPTPEEIRRSTFRTRLSWWLWWISVGNALPCFALGSTHTRLSIVRLGFLHLSLIYIIYMYASCSGNGAIQIMGKNGALYPIQFWLAPWMPQIVLLESYRSRVNHPSNIKIKSDVC